VFQAARYFRLFMFRFLTLSLAETVLGGVIGRIMNIELEGMWKEAISTWFEVLLRHLARGTVENEYQNIQWQDRDLNSGLPEYKADMQITQHDVLYPTLWMKVLPCNH
jgi:hypothetical protein